MTFHRYTTKSGDPRRLPLTVALAAELDMVVPRSVSGVPFPLRPGTAWHMWEGLRSDLGAGGVMSRYTPSGTPA